MTDVLNKSIRLSTPVKYSLDSARGKKSSNDFINDMLLYFEITGINPKSQIKNPNDKIEKRIEDLIKIVKSHERDYLKPLKDEKSSQNKVPENNAQLLKLAKENEELRYQIKSLKEKSANKEDLELYKTKLNELAKFVINACQTTNFSNVSFSSDFKVPPSFFEKLILEIQKKYVL